MEPSSEESKAGSPDRSVVELLSEFLFLLFPLVVVGSIASYKGGLRELVGSPEWAFGACVVFGQLLVRLASVASSARAGLRVKRHNLALLLSMLIVFGLCPAVIVLTLVLLQDTVSVALGLAQVAIFCLSGTCYFVLGRLIALMDGRRS